MKFNIVVICGSVRPDSNSLKVSKFFAKKLQTAGHQAQTVDFMRVPLPLVNSKVSPSKLKKVYPDPNVQAWSAIANAADAFVIVAPEYNHGISGTLKNALDWLYAEYNHKPVGLVGVSDGDGGGIRAVEMLRQIMANFAMYDIREAVYFRKAQDAVDADGNLLDPSYEKRVDGLIASLTKVAEAMKALRT